MNTKIKIKNQKAKIVQAAPGAELWTPEQLRPNKHG
jgi:hypothetical protein